MENVTYRNFTIKIEQDGYNESSREWENLATMVCKHSNYTLGDTQLKTDHDLPMFEYFNNEYDIINDHDDYSFSDKQNITISNWIEKNAIMLPLYLYDHGGITMRTTSFSCKWDSGQVGFIYVLKSDIRKEWQCKRVSKKLYKHIENNLIQEVKTYDDYLTGDIYSYCIEDSEDVIDSCSGFYGYDHKKSGLLEYAENAIDCHIDRLKKSHFQKVKQWIKSKTPLQYRQALQF